MCQTNFTDEDKSSITFTGMEDKSSKTFTGREDKSSTDAPQNELSCCSYGETVKGFENLSRSLQLAVLSFVLFLFFGAHNVLQEAMMKLPGFNFGIMLGYMEVLGVTVWSYADRKYVAQETGRVGSLSSYPLLTICLMASSSLSTMSLNYINFPTKVVFRSCKLIPTMVIATVMTGKKFSCLQYLCAFSVCLGLGMFALGDWSIALSFDPTGLILVSLSVVADSITPNLQERLFREGSSRLEVTFFSNFFTLIAMTITTGLSGDLVGVIRYASQDNQLVYYMCIYTTISYVAISAFMSIIKRFGAVVGVTLSTARKMMTLILSFILFPKPFNLCYLFGAIFVLGGVLVSSLSKKMKKCEVSDILHIGEKIPPVEKVLLLTENSDIENRIIERAEQIRTDES